MKTRKFALVWLVLLGFVVAACGSVASPPTTTSSGTSSLTLVKSITVASQSGNFHTPLDSTPDMAGTTIYFTATGPHGPGVFRVPAAGGAATEVYTGLPFVAPRGIVFSTDGQHLYVTDARAGAGGEIFQISPNGGRPAPVRGSAGTAPQNLYALSQHGQQVVYFTGKDPVSGQPAVFKLSASGEAAPTVVVKGSPLVTPDGIAVTPTGDVYVSDRAASGGGIGKIFKINGGTVSVLIDRVRTGNPAGIALTQVIATGQYILLASALQLDGSGDQVLVVNLSTNQTSSVTKGIAQNHSGAGLHGFNSLGDQASIGQTWTDLLAPFHRLAAQQEKTEIFSWADLTAGGGTGAVYKVEL